MSAVPSPDLPTAGSGLDYSDLGRAQGISAAEKDYLHQQSAERLAGGLILLAIILVIGAGCALWNRRRFLAESAAQGAVRGIDNAHEKAASFVEWWRKQADAARRHDQ